MLDVELTQSIARLRRAMPRNPDVLVVCEALERLGVSTRGASKFDKVAYQRSYMRDYRAGKRRRVAA